MLKGNKQSCQMRTSEFGYLMVQDSSVVELGKRNRASQDDVPRFGSNVDDLSWGEKISP